METIDFNVLISLIAIIIMFAFLHQELSVKPLLSKMKNAANRIFNEMGIESLEIPVGDKLQEAYDDFKKEYQDLHSFLMSSTKDYQCNSQQIWKDEETSQCKFLKNFIVPNKSYNIVNGIIYGLIVTAFMIAIASPSIELKIFIMAYIPLEPIDIYYFLLFVLSFCLIFILYSIHMFNKIEYQLFGKEKNKIDQLEVKYIKKYNDYQDKVSSRALKIAQEADTKTKPIQKK